MTLTRAFTPLVLVALSAVAVAAQAPARPQQPPAPTQPPTFRTETTLRVWKVSVVDREGKFLRQWQPEGTASVHCLGGASDGTIYVCGRQSGQVHAYDKQGRLLKTIEVLKTASGTDATAIGFSPDRDQKLLYVLNQATSEIEIIDRRSGKILSSFGGGVGTGPGQFEQPHGLAVDSKGNVYIAENRGKRIQKFRIGK